MSVTLVFSPIPFSNVVPAFVIVLISLAYLEEDGLLLSVALLTAVMTMTAAIAGIWETLRGAEWMGKLW